MGADGLDLSCPGSSVVGPNVEEEIYVMNLRLANLVRRLQFRLTHAPNLLLQLVKIGCLELAVDEVFLGNFQVLFSSSFQVRESSI